MKLSSKIITRPICYSVATVIATLSFSAMTQAQVQIQTSPIQTPKFEIIYFVPQLNENIQDDISLPPYRPLIPQTYDVAVNPNPNPNADGDAWILESATSEHLEMTTER